MEISFKRISLALGATEFLGPTIPLSYEEHLVSNARTLEAGGMGRHFGPDASVSLRNLLLSAPHYQLRKEEVIGVLEE
jgi:hypothetical protein